MKLASCVGVALLLIPASAAAQIPYRDVGNKLPWRGEKVIVLKGAGTINTACTDHRETSQEPAYSQFGDKTGIIADIAEGPAGRTALTIKIDGSGDQLVLCHERPLGFESELAIAKTLVGKPLWTVGRRSLIGVDGASSVVPNTGHLVVVSAEWGDDANPIRLRFRTDEGVEGTLEGGGSERGFDDRYHPSTAVVIRMCCAYLDRFYREDPRNTYPTWTSATWNAITRGDVAAGMTEPQAHMACGRGFRPEGVTSEGGRVVRCDAGDFFKKFVVQGGKVTRLLD